MKTKCKIVAKGFFTVEDFGDCLVKAGNELLRYSETLGEPNNNNSRHGDLEESE